VTAGPPAAATGRIPQGVTAGKPDSPSSRGQQAGAKASDMGKAASLLKKLNAAHASEQGLAHASSKSVVGALREYKSDTVEAQEAIASYTDAVAKDQAAVSDAEAAVAKAQTDLAAAESASPTDQAAIDAAKAALADAQADLTAAQTQLSTDQAALADAQSDLLAAQTTLADATDTTLTSETIVALNSLLGL
jgi:chromosome segregation ATPase